MLSTILSLSVAAYLSSLVSGLVGMAGGILLLGAMTVVMPISIIVPIHGIVQLTSNVSRTLMLIPHIKKPYFYSFLFGTPFGGYLGYLILSRIQSPYWLFGVVAVLLSYIAFKPKKLPDIKLPERFFWILGAVASCLGCLIGATGPLLAPFFIRHDFTKEEIVATKASCQVLIHLVKIPTFMALSFPYKDHLTTIIIMVIMVIIGTKSGVYFLKRIDGTRFFSLVRLACVVMAIRLVYKLIQFYF
ncbi:hypothetical protein DID77_00310 [Candidatus Marinamargulisbacteria bacterium SCGC AG-439-L15]|nr:hypothetical protein DID77_00310 [Candidatus Marinamargulisbacteria bacterium SCGC AG-439-L15]